MAIYLLHNTSMLNNKRTTYPDPDASGRKVHDYSGLMIKVQMSQIIDVLPPLWEPYKNNKKRLCLMILWNEIKNLLISINILTSALKSQIKIIRTWRLSVLAVKKYFNNFLKQNLKK